MEYNRIKETFWIVKAYLQLEADRLIVTNERSSVQFPGRSSAAKMLLSLQCKRRKQWTIETDFAIGKY